MHDSQGPGRQDAFLLRQYPMISLTVAAAFGVATGNTVGWLAQWLLGLGFVGFLVGRLFNRRGLAWCCLCVVMAALFAMHYQQRELAHENASLGSYLGEQAQPAILRARLLTRVELRQHPFAAMGRQVEPWQSIFEVQAESLRVGLDFVPVEGNLRVIVDGQMQHLLPGDRVEVMGGLRGLSAPSNPGEIDYRSIFSARNLQGTVRVQQPGQIMRLSTGYHWQRWVASFGASGERILRKTMGHEQATLAAALILGRREAVNPTLRQKLLATGTAHLLSVSGLHLGMVAAAVTWLTVIAGLSPRQQLCVIVLFCLFYAGLTGARPPVVRAALLVSVLLLGSYTGRKVNPLNALAMAALVLLIGNPANLSNVGVQLSFLAVGTLMVVGRAGSGPDASQQAADPLQQLVQQRLAVWRRRLNMVTRKVASAVWLSLSVWAITAPLIWYHFHVFAPITVMANVLLALPLMVALLSGLVAVLAGVIWLPLAAIPATVCQTSLTGIVWMIEIATAIPRGHLWLPAPPGWWVVLFYLVLVGVWLLSPKNLGGRFRSLQRWSRAGQQKTRCVALASFVVWVGLGMLLATAYRTNVLHGIAPGQIEITFVDVRHGTCVLMRLDNGEVWLYDCGSLGSPLFSSRPIEAVLWEKGIRRIDTIALSHADADHYNALPQLLNRFRIGRIITPPGMLQRDKPGIAELRRLIHTARVPVHPYHAGQQISLADSLTNIDVLHPPLEPLPGNDNVNSLVLQVAHAGRILLLPGDLETPGTEAVLALPRPPPKGILMSPHHGSLQEDSRPLLDWARPHTVVISGGTRAARPEVLRAMSQNGAETFVTALHGAIAVSMDQAGNVQIKTFSPPKRRSRLSLDSDGG